MVAQLIKNATNSVVRQPIRLVVRQVVDVQKVDITCSMAKKVCTPFCDPKKPCPKHHDLLVAALNCSDRRDQSANAAFEHFQTTVKDYLKKGWKMDEDVPDPSRNYRYPLLHWVAVLGKCRALEWMINFGR